MKKHIYLHSSNLENMRALRDDADFQPLYGYPHDEAHRSSRHEYGRIKTRDNFYHILLGNMEQKGCPWCKGDVEVRNSITSVEFGWCAYWIQCDACGARGPKLNIVESITNDPKDMEEIMNLLWHRFNHRRQWDEDFHNPYVLAD